MRATKPRLSQLLPKPLFPLQSQRALTWWQLPILLSVLLCFSAVELYAQAPKPQPQDRHAEPNPETAKAESNAVSAPTSAFFESSDLSLKFPNWLSRQACTQEQTQASRGLCAVLRYEELSFLAFLSFHQKIFLHSREALQQHLDDSQKVLEGQNAIDFLDKRILNSSFLLAQIELLRRDEAIQDITKFEQLPLKQVNLLIPFAHDQLAQLFLYFPTNSTLAEDIQAQVLFDILNELRVHQVLQQHTETTTEREDPPSQATKSSLDVLPQALKWGTLLALLIIVTLQLNHRWQQRRRKDDVQLSDDDHRQLLSYLDEANTEAKRSCDANKKDQEDAQL